MESDSKHAHARMEQIQKVVNLLMVKMEEEEAVQHHMVAQMALTTQSFD
jgi:hypothetical protein